jgi:hypothetical protein
VTPHRSVDALIGQKFLILLSLARLIVDCENEQVIVTNCAASVSRLHVFGGFAPTALRSSQHIFAIETILNITATTSAEIFAALCRLVGARASLHSVHTLRL